MSIKIKLLIPMIVVTIITALTLLISSIILFNPSRGMIWTFIAVSLITILILFAVSLKFISYISDWIIAPISKNLNQLNYDELTGIHSRRYFIENINRILTTLARSGDSLSLMIVGIDFFKIYNDTYGQVKGDECLKLIAETLMKTLTRTDDFVARFGGKEFVVVLPNTDEGGAHIIAAKLLKSIRALAIPHEGSSVADFVTVSVGVTSGNVEHVQGSSEYINRADEMLYTSKLNGRNRYSYLEITGKSPLTLSSAKKTIDTLRRSKELAETLTKVAISFLTMQNITFDYIMSSGVNNIANFLYIDCISVWRYIWKPEGLHLSQVYLWDKEAGGTIPPKADLVDVVCPETEQCWEKILSTGGVINGPLRVRSDFEAGLLREHGLLSVLAVPMFINNTFGGFVLCSDGQCERIFDDAGTDLMRSVAVLFASAVNHTDIANEAN
ncbi:MAG: GGDEF domain-containing protein [Lachnospiraceae bacterium]|nr:GGDEF domain-containing protein [Lachnospiraceae bacterium]